MKRALSLFLAVLMTVSVFQFTSYAAGTESNISTVDGMDKLGIAYNMLGDVYIEDAPSRQIFIGTDGLTAQYLSTSRSESKYTYITSTSEYFNNMSQSFNVNYGLGQEISGKINVKFLELNLSSKYSLDFSYSGSTSGSSSEKNSKEYALLEYLYEIGVYTMWLDNKEQIARLWSTNDNGDYTILHKDFVDSLLNDDPEVFFSNYGSHIVTRYTAGGSAISSYYGELSLESTETGSNHSTSLSSNWEGAISKKKELDIIYNAANGSSEESSIKMGSDFARGGEGNFSWTGDGASKWASSINRDNAVILVDDNLKLLPVWELLVDTAQVDRRIELEQYFNENIDEQYADIYSDYIYKPTGNKDFSGYTFIQTAEEFNNIRNNLNGKYVLINNIDLSSYSEWSPIGTADAPFTGTFDGNGNTVSGLSITACNTYAGLFGYSAGTIENVAVSGSINAVASDNENNVAYIGGIVGYNAGTISQCLNSVSVNGEMTVTEASAVSTSTQSNWFDTNKAAIESAKSASLTTLADNTTYNVGLTPVRLSGTASGVTVNVTGNASSGTAFLVLENANITGTIINPSDRPMCIISKGTSNTIIGSTDTIAINSPNANVNICGEATLTITGGTGSTGSTGNVGAGGAIAIVAPAIEIDASNVTICGGKGGTGGKGSTGSTGSNGSSTSDMWVDTTPHSTKQGAGGTGGKGGSGGNGGVGALPILKDSTIKIYSGTTLVKYGDGGNGGTGGTGGKGGTGHAGSDADKEVGS